MPGLWLTAWHNHNLWARLGVGYRFPFARGGEGRGMLPGMRNIKGHDDPC